MDVSSSVGRFMSGRLPCSREASFDYCFNYFQQAHQDGVLDGICHSEHLETSCLQLGFYLASWGMFRGKAKLLQHSSRFYESAVSAIASADPAIWTLDVWEYDQATARLIVGESERIRSALFSNASDTLVTKIMLGVYGCVPAFDSYFKQGFGHGFSPKSLVLLRRQFEGFREEVDACRPCTIDFSTGAVTTRRYTAAKVVDMHYFIAGGGPAASTSSAST